MEKRTIPILFLVLFALTVSGQNFPSFLNGTWKLENKETYEHWDLVQPNQLKGFLYKLKDGKLEVDEYLDIQLKENNIVYTATVLNQNQGKGVDFKLVSADSIFSFENPAHDFPQFIRYKPINKNEMQVIVGNKERSFTLLFRKQD